MRIVLITVHSRHDLPLRHDTSADQHSSVLHAQLPVMYAKIWMQGLYLFEAISISPTLLNVVSSEDVSSHQAISAV